MDDVEQATADVHRAHRWAKNHFNAYVDEEHTPSHLLARPTFAVTFPDVDILQVAPVNYGQANAIALAEYRLCWKDGKLYWKGGFVLRPDIVSYLQVP